MTKLRSTTPRLMLPALHSGAGKTTLTCALLQALGERGLKAAAFKGGPDYIDPMFHREILGVASHNLDLFFLDEDSVRGLLAYRTTEADIAILEGVMGFYDGVGGGATASSWHLARVTQTPVVLVADPKGMSLSLAAMLQGLAAFRSPSHIAGVILNNCSASLYSLLQPLIQQETGLSVLGYLPRLPECAFNSRHLGLDTELARTEVRHKLQLLAEQVERTVALDALLALAATASPLQGCWEIPEPLCTGRPKIAVAKDEAFCFYYPENLAYLQACGAEVCEFSPLNDATLPSDCSGLYLGGGYPEAHAARLSTNLTLRRNIREAIAAGLPTFAECGGFMYLHAELEGEDGNFYPMAAALPARAFRTPRLQRFGYAKLTALRDTAFCSAGSSFPIHEFHYWDSTEPGDAFLAQKPTSQRSWNCIISSANLLAGFPHFYFPAAPELATGFVRAAAAYRRELK